MWTVDIDVGGTLTDGIASGGPSLISAKVDTTPHDLTVCLFECLSKIAANANYPETAAFLEDVDLIRWSTTITSNILAEQRGPRIGLLVSSGHEKDLYSPDANSALIGRWIAGSDIIPVDGGADDTRIMNAARSLLEAGVRRICVSLEGAHRDPKGEIHIKQVIEQQYPDHFLGSVPVLAGSDISKSSDDKTRTYCAVINAYTHGALAATLFKAEDELRQGSRYTGSFLVSHINGGVAGVSKTKAIDTIESGPILGVYGSAFLAKVYGLSEVVAMDIGGTTAKVSVVVGSEPIHKKPSDFFGLPVEISLPYLHSVALGGGSVVTVADRASGAAIQLGPQSMGSFPGPACYGLGGDQPTLTDAFVAAGLINPDYFLGGTKPLHKELAEQVIGDWAAGSIQTSRDEACRMIIDRAFEIAGELIASAGTDLTRDLSGHTLFAYGGNGGLFAMGVAEKAGLSKVMLFSLGPVFSAFGSAVSEIAHVYERTVPPNISEASIWQVQGILEEMKAEGAKDLLGEGTPPEHVSYSIEFDVASNGKRSIPVTCSESALASAVALQSSLLNARALAGEAPCDICLELIRLRVRKPMSKLQMTQQPLEGPDASGALTGARRVLWGSANGEARIYRWELLRSGNRLEGPAVLEGLNSTYFIPGGWTCAIDPFGNGQVSRDADGKWL